MNWTLFLLSIVAIAGVVMTSVLLVSLLEMRNTMMTLRHKIKNLEHVKTCLEMDRTSTEFNARELERERIAGSLHDDVGSSLTALKLNVQSLQRMIGKESRLDVVFMDISGLVDESIRRYRDIVLDISPSTLQHFGVGNALMQMCQGYNDSVVMRVRFEEIGESRRFDMKRELAVYRIAQELVCNAMKHANAWEASVKLTWCDEYVELLVNDSGAGVKEYKEVNGLGLLNIVNNVKLFGGSYNRDVEYKGSSFRIRIPYESKVENTHLHS